MGITKKQAFEKKVFVYIEAVLYALLVIITIYGSIYGSVILKLIPMVFLLGLVGKIVFDRPVVTSLFGFCVTLCVIQMIGGYSLKYNFLLSIYNFLCIMLGEMAGTYILKIYNSKAKTLTNNTINHISLTALTIFLGIFFNQYMNGNMIDYIGARNTLKEYIYKNYPDVYEKMDIKKVRYLSGELKYYSFTIEGLSEDGKTYNMGVYLNNKVIDGYYDSCMATKTENLEQKFKFKFKEEFNGLDVDVYYTDLNGTITLKISKNIEQINDSEISNFANDINDVLTKVEEFDEYGNIYKINALLKSEKDIVSGEIFITDFYSIEKYIESFDVEYFDL